MASFHRITVLAALILIGILLPTLKILLIYFIILIILELLTFKLIKSSRKKFPWLITPEDETPEIDEKGLDKFMPHGFDAELGWIRKPSTSKQEIGKEGSTEYHIDKRGSRKNPGHEDQPTIISCYGDSFAFARQVNDNETWEAHLSDLTKTNVLNFGVGNYGLDQSLLRLKREYPKNKTNIVIIGVVPSTIVRVMCLWKHYNEFGNTFAFKPMFKITNNQLELIKNKIDSRDKFLNLNEYLDYFRSNDYLYKIKFREEMIRFPYLVSTLSRPSRNLRLIWLIWYSHFFEKDKKDQVYSTPMKVIMDVNLRLRYKLFKKSPYAVKLMIKLVEDFVNYSKKENFTPIFLFMPQKDDILFIKRKGIYYNDFMQSIKEKLPAIDLTQALLKAENLDDLYSDDTKYGGHYSRLGNKVIAGMIYKSMKEQDIKW